MANEDAPQGIDDLLDDIPDAEPQPADVVPEPEDVVPEPEAPAAETPAAEPEPQPEAEPTPESPESIAEAQSQVAKLFPQVDHSGKTVPVDKHIELRRKKQEAEARADAAEAQLANVDTSALDELANLIENSEDDYIDKSTLKSVVGKLPEAIKNIAQQVNNVAVQTANTTNLIAKIKTDETAFRKDNADYDAVTDFVISRISDAERQAVFAQPNAAQAMYELGQQKIAETRQALGIAAPSTPQPKIDNTPTDEQPAAPAADANEEFDPIGDDEAFDMFAGGGQGS